MSVSVTHALIGQALAGNQDSWGVLLERLRPRMVLWAASRMSARLRSKIEPEDLAQEILLAVHRDLHQFQGTDTKAFLGWVFRIAGNRIRDTADHFGAKKRQTGALMTFSQTSPSAAAARSESVDRLSAALPRLREDYRRVIELLRFEELTTAEVGVEMDRTENAVRVLYCRALKALRKELEENS